MSCLKFHFERGGFLVASLKENAPSTLRAVTEILPIESRLQHTRWCGREVYLPITTLHAPAKENQTGIVSKFDLTYWRDWDVQEGAAEALSLFYGAERLSFHGGLLTVNVIGRILWEYEEMLDAIGERVWSSGFEGVRAELLPE